MNTIEIPEPGELLLFDNQYKDRKYKIEINVEEFTCLCPMTGQPDYAKFKIIYTPDKYVVELKSLKLYLQKYRNIGITHENVTNEILDKLVSTLKPYKIEVIGYFNIRGGIQTTVSVYYIKGD